MSASGEIPPRRTVSATRRPRRVNQRSITKMSNAASASVTTALIQLSLSCQKSAKTAPRVSAMTVAEVSPLPVAEPVRTRLPGWRSSLREAALALLWSRLLVWVAGLAGLAAFGRAPGTRRFDPAGLTEPLGPVGDALLAPAARWDSMWFLLVARDGYDTGERAAFFPLYPLLVHAGGWLVGSAAVAGVLISLACALAALTVLHRLAALELGPAAARPAVLAVAFFPTAFFLSGVYSESLFLALSAGAFLAARSDRWWAAGVLGALAAGTRSAGVLLVVPLALLWLRPPGGGARPPLRSLAWVALVPGGLAAVCAYLGVATGDPWAPFAAQDVWMRSFAGPFAGAWDGAVAAFEGARQLLSGGRVPVYFEAAGGDSFEVARRNLCDFAFLVFAVVATVGALRRLPLAYGAWAVAALALPLSWPVEPEPLMSLPRFVLVLFPLQLWAAAWVAERRWGERAAAVSGGLLALFSAQFACWVWVA